MVTVASAGVPPDTPVGSKNSSIVSIKSSSGSSVSSLLIEILNVTVVAPAGIVTVYAPEL